MESENLKFQKGKERYKMALLFIQTKEIQKLYNSNIENSPKNYYLVSKEWLDKYKKDNNYDYAKSMFNSFNEWENYSDFKQKISKYFDKDKINFTIFKAEDALDNIFNFSLKKAIIKNFNIAFPADCELVKEEFFKDCSYGSLGFPQYEIFIGNKLIIIKDAETQNVVFLCSLIQNEDNKNNSLVKVNCVLAFENEIYMKNELNEIISNSNNINNYFSQRNIDINTNDSQNLNSPDGKRLGILFIIKDKQLNNKSNQDHQNKSNKNYESNNSENSKIQIQNNFTNNNNNNENIKFGKEINQNVQQQNNQDC